MSRFFDFLAGDWAFADELMALRLPAIMAVVLRNWRRDGWFMVIGLLGLGLLPAALDRIYRIFQDLQDFAWVAECRTDW